MRFFKTLRRRLAATLRYAASAVDDEREPADDPESGPGSAVHDADPKGDDRVRWRKRLLRILDELPGSQGEWADLLADARALSFSDDWVRECQVDEFILLVRRAVKDRVLTQWEHRKIDQARELIGLSREEAASALRSVVAEAESFFGKPVKGA